MRVFHSHSNASKCTNVTEHYTLTMSEDKRTTGHKMDSAAGYDRRAIFVCQDSTSSTPVRILNFPTCDGSMFGAKGPCCRCNGAMKFFLDLHFLLKSSTSVSLPGSSLRGSRAGEFHRPPDWFIFADDDYFLRMHYIEAVLSNYPAKNAYAIKLWGNGDEATKTRKGNISSQKEKGVDQGREGMGMFIYNSNCSQPCTHRLSWMGLGGYSIGAMRQLQGQIENDALVKVCRRLSLTHDVGLGVFTWMNSMDVIRLIEHVETLENIHHVPLTEASHFEAALTHNHEHKSYSELFQHILSKTHSEGTSTLDVHKFVQHEIELGMMTNKILLPFHYRGFKNTVFYRKRQVLEAMLDGIFVNSSSSIVKEDLPPLPENTDYLFSDCNDDAQVFKEWLVMLNTTSEESEPQMCLRYTQHISNFPVFNEAELDAIIHHRSGDALFRS